MSIQPSTKVDNDARAESRFKQTSVYVDSESKEKRFGVWKKPDIDVSTFTRFAVTVKHIDRPDLISYEVYGDHQWWWAILQVNNVKNAFAELYVGQVLLIPPLDAIRNSLLEEE